MPRAVGGGGRYLTNRNAPSVARLHCPGHCASRLYAVVRPGRARPKQIFPRRVQGAVPPTGGVYKMKRHLHLAIGLSSVLLAACCLAGAGLAWLRAAVGAVAQAALLCTMSEPAQLPEDTTITMATSRTTETAVPPTGFWFGATVRPDFCPEEPIPGPAVLSDARNRNPAPPGTAGTGPGLPGGNGTIT